MLLFQRAYKTEKLQKKSAVSFWKKNDRIFISTKHFHISEQKKQCVPNTQKDDKVRWWGVR